MALPAEAYRLTNISSKAYEHPADRAATAALGSIPMLDYVVRKLIEFGYERALRQTYLGASVRLGHRPAAAHLGAPTSARSAALDMPEEYDLYLTQQPLANAATIGAGKPIIVLNSATVELLDERGIEAVIGHELGHILSDHVLYRTALMILIRLGSRVRLPILAGTCRCWPCATRCSSGRARRSCPAIARRRSTTRDPRVVCSMLMTMSGGARADELNLDAFKRQAMEYTEGGGGLDRLQRLLSDLQLDHALPVKRVHELHGVGARAASTTASSAASTRAAARSARAAAEEAADAAAHYSDVFKDALPGGRRARLDAPATSSATGCATCRTGGKTTSRPEPPESPPEK